MAPIAPLVQPPVEDLRSALVVAQSGPDMFQHLDHEQDAASAFGDISRLILHALDQFGEPSLAAVQAAATMIREYDGSRIADGDLPRHARDVAAAIVHAQLTGNPPPTWSEK